MITEKEKIKMIKEVGMIGRVKKLMEKKEIEKLTNMKFIPTSYDRIEKQISSWYYRVDSSPSPLSSVTAILGILTFIFSTISTNPKFGPVNYYLPGVMFLLTIILTPFVFLHKTVIVRKPLENWEDDIPYGALLAIKEAKKAGLKSFEVYYPTTHRNARLMADPVIVGWTEKHRIGKMYGNRINQGKMMEVFAWDDGKIYE